MEPVSPASPSGVEAEPLQDGVTKNAFVPARFRLIQAVLHDQTDAHAELLQENKWLLHPSQGELRLQGNAFALESTLDGSGTVFLKLAPLPTARSRRSDWDVRAARDGSFELRHNFTGRRGA